LALDPVVQKWESFGWNVISIDGHSLEEVLKAYDWAEQMKGKPTLIIARTVKGKGVSFMENQPGWHGRAPKPAELEKALAELRVL
jgi:transketolase